MPKKVKNLLRVFLEGWLTIRIPELKKWNQVCKNKEVTDMSNISELDLQNLRHLIGGFDTTHCKMQAYAKEATDPQIRQFFEKGAKSAMDNKQQLMKFLG